jgi:hypothetical protein
MNKLLFLFILINIHIAISIKPTFSTIEQFNHRYHNHKIISISPGGVGGYYLLGIITYIKENYYTENFCLLGASAGAWNCLPMSYNKNINTITNNLLLPYDLANECSIDDYLCNYDIPDDNVNSIYNLQCNIKSMLINNYKNEDFNLNQINIATTIFTKKGFEQIIISDLKSLNRTIDCCFASSHIPFVTGKCLLKLDDVYFFDGGFKEFPHNSIDTHFDICLEMWGFKFNDCLNVEKYKKNGKLLLYKKGYRDSMENKDTLNKYFKPI